MFEAHVRIYLISFLRHSLFSAAKQFEFALRHVFLNGKNSVDRGDSNIALLMTGSSFASKLFG